MLATRCSTATEESRAVASVRVDSLLDAREAGLAMELVGGRGGLSRRISGPRVQKPGLALTGYTNYVHPERLQVLGLTEISFLRQAAPEARQSGLDALCALEPWAVGGTRGVGVAAALGVG